MRGSKMDMDNFHVLTGVMFLFVLLVHGTRVFNGWDVFIGPCVVPMWVSYVVVLIAGYLAYHAFGLMN